MIVYRSGETPLLFLIALGLSRNFHFINVNGRALLILNRLTLELRPTLPHHPIFHPSQAQGLLGDEAAFTLPGYGYWNVHLTSSPTDSSSHLLLLHRRARSCYWVTKPPSCCLDTATGTCTSPRLLLTPHLTSYYFIAGPGVATGRRSRLHAAWIRLLERAP